eukprot:145202_1
MLQLQQKIMKICKDNEYNELFYKTIAKKISMMFYDAKAVISKFIDHVISTDNKKIKVLNIITIIGEKLTKDIPFVGTVINLLRSVVNKTYDIFVLQTFANNVINFESLYGCDGSKF